MPSIRPRAVCVVLVLVLLGVVTAGLATAAVSPLWEELGGSASGGGVSGAVPPAAARDASVAVGPDGLPVVAYTASPDAVSAQGAITVKRWTGATWETLSGPAGLAQGRAPQVRIAASGAIHVAWLQEGVDGNAEIHLRVRTTMAFEALGESDSAGGLSGVNPGITAPFSLALDGAGNPLVAFVGVVQNDVPAITATPAIVHDTQQVYVRRWTGSDWVFLGSDFAGGGASNALSFLTPGGAIQHDADAPALTVDSQGTPVVAFSYFTVVNGQPSANTDVYVARWTGGTWAAVGPAVPAGDTPAGNGGPGGVSRSGTGSLNPSIAAGSGGHLALAWEEETPTGASHVWVRLWNGSGWIELAGSASGSGIVPSGTMNVAPRIELEGTSPVVAWQHRSLDAPSQIFVRRWNGTAWVEIGLHSATNAGISDAAVDAVMPALAAPPGTGVRVVAWVDVRETGGGQVFLRRRAPLAGTLRLTVSITTPPGASGQDPVGTISGPGGVCGVEGGPACEALVASGTRLALVAGSAPGNRFLNWSGGLCHGRTSATCEFTLAASTSTAAVFRAVTALRVTKAGNGKGTVSGTGFACGADCFEEVFTGTTRGLSATPATGSRFLGWSGDACDGQASGSCLVTASGLDQSVTATFQLNRHRLAVTVTGPGTGFTVSDPAGIDCGAGRTACTTDYDYDTLVHLTPSPGPDSMVQSWSGCTRLSGSICSVRMTAGRAVTLRFVPARTLTVAASGNGSGRIVTSTAPGLVCVNSCSESRRFPLNVALVLTPQPAVGTSFQWTGGVCTGRASCSVVMSENRGASGQFTLNRHSLAVASRPGGRVASLPPLDGVIACGSGGGACATVADYGTPVVLQAIPAEGFVFVRWAGVTCAGGDTNARCAFPLRANVTATPTFRARTLVTVVKGGNGAGTVSAPGISCGLDCAEAVFDGRTIGLTAAPAVGSRFVGFSGDCVSSTSGCTFLPQGNNRTVTATFELIRYTVTVSDRPSGAVADINGLPDGIACGAGGTDCLASLDFGTRVVLRATPIAGSRFVSWTGGICHGLTSATCGFTVPARSVSLAPTYRRVTTLTLDKSGLGTISSSPGGISCGPTCSSAAFDFPRGALVHLLASPAVGWSFDGFTGGCTGLTCQVDTSAISTLVGASFSIQSRRLSVTVAGNGSVNGPGFSCDPSTTPCRQEFDYGTTLPLTPVAAEGHRFIGWSGNCVGAGPTACKPLLTANHSVTATFRRVFTMSVTKTGSSNTGAITSSPAGINCGVTATDCSEVYLGGTMVTLTRSAPVTGTQFKWGGDCAFSGTSATCTLPMNANRSVVGEYRLLPLGLTVNKRGAPYGTVTRVNGALDCGADCFEVVNYGTSVTLRATPAETPASEFVSWTGCTPATSLSCTFTLTANRTVTATFRPLVTGLRLESFSDAPLGVGGIRQLSAIATFSDGTERDVSGQTTTTTWTATSTPAGVVSVSASGLVTGRLAGNASVWATFRRGTQVIASAPLAIHVSALVADTTTQRAITVTCTPYGEPTAPASQLACLPSNRSFEVHCQAFGQFADGGPPADITEQVVWKTTNAAIARPTGLVAFSGPLRQSFRMVGAGTAALHATLGSRTSATSVTGLGVQPWVVQGSPQTVVSASVIQPLTGVVAGGQTQLEAIATLVGTGACASPPARDFSLLVGWASDNEAVATVSFFGRVTGVSPGSVTIRATYGTIPLDPVTLVVQSP